MTLWICATCGVEHADSDAPPSTCAICSDDRQGVPKTGQAWTTHDQLQRDGTRVDVAELEPDLYAVRTQPGVGIAPRGLLVRTPGGNLLWEPPGYLDTDAVQRLRALGGVHAVASSHPHLVGASVSWSHAFGGVPVWWAQVDRRWIRRPDPVLRLWSGEQEMLPGLRLLQTGGHFPGSAVAHWAAGANGRGALLSGDTIMVGGDRASVSFMRSYVNLLPLPERLVRRIVTTVQRHPYDRIYGAFGEIGTDAQQIVLGSAERFVGWMRDEIRDPDEEATDLSS
ncbi:MAG: hydrolase [Nocardioidaceae bacterium]|jgi:hypothetical protein|nr:hydrolase [Nocardioidaceae bacterium]